VGGNLEARDEIPFVLFSSRREESEEKLRFSEREFLKQGFLEIEGMKQAEKQTNRSGKGMRVAPAKLGRLGGIAEGCMEYKKYRRLKEK